MQNSLTERVTAMSNSKLVNYRLDSPNYSIRQDKISIIIPHHMAGNLSIENCCAMFAQPSRQASSNYCIGTDGRVGQSVDEKYRAWTTGNRIDHKAVTIEVANDQTCEPWHVSDVAFGKLVDLCTDICQRNGIEKLIYTGDKTGNLQQHRWYAPTGCPGTYLASRFQMLASMVNARLTQDAQTQTPQDTTRTLYRVRRSANDAKSQVGAFYDLGLAKKYADQFEGYSVFVGIKCVYVGKQSQTGSVSGYLVRVTVTDLRIRKGPGLSYVSAGYIAPGKYTIVAEQEADGHVWGQLRSGAGWIALEYVERV